MRASKDAGACVVCAAACDSNKKLQTRVFSESQLAFKPSWTQDGRYHGWPALPDERRRPQRLKAPDVLNLRVNPWCIPAGP
jgi:hypothetical protein